MSIAARLGPHTTIDLDRVLFIERVETRWFDKEDGLTTRLVDHVRGVRPSAHGGFDPALRWHLSLTNLEDLGPRVLFDLAKMDGLSEIRKLTLDLSCNRTMQGLGALLAAPGMASLEWLYLSHAHDVRREPPPDGAALVDALRDARPRLRALECGGFTWNRASCEAVHHVAALASLECLSLAACRFADDSLPALFPPSSPIRLRELSISDTDISDALIRRLCDTAVLVDVEELALWGHRLTTAQASTLQERFGSRLRGDEPRR